MKNVLSSRSASSCHARVRVRQQHLRLLLEDRRDRHHRHVGLGVVELAEQVAAHVEVDLAGGQQLRVVDLRPALPDRSRRARAWRRCRRPPPDSSRHARPGPSSSCRRSPCPGPWPGPPSDQNRRSQHCRDRARERASAPAHAQSSVPLPWLPRPGGSALFPQSVQQPYHAADMDASGRLGESVLRRWAIL